MRPWHDGHTWCAWPVWLPLAHCRQTRFFAFGSFLRLLMSLQAGKAPARGKRAGAGGQAVAGSAEGLTDRASQ